MSVPAMYHVGCGFDWFLMLLTLGGYFYILRKTGRKWVFMLLIFTAEWIVMGLSYVFLISGASTGEWYITLIRVVGYVLFLAMTLTMIIELAKLGKRTI